MARLHCRWRRLRSAKGGTVCLFLSMQRLILEKTMRLSHTLAAAAVEPVATRSSWGIILPIAAVALLIALAGS
jgi:hypothetical protein